MLFSLNKFQQNFNNIQHNLNFNKYSTQSKLLNHNNKIPIIIVNFFILINFQQQ